MIRQVTYSRSSLPGDKSPGTGHSSAVTASGAPYHTEHYWVFITIITFFTREDLVIKEMCFVLFFFLLSQNISHQMKAFKSSSLHHVHSWQTLFVTRTFSSILFHHGTKDSFTGWSSIRGWPHSVHLKSLWPISTTITPHTCVFSTAPFREQLHTVQMSMMLLWAWNLLEDIGYLYHCVIRQLTWHSVF